MIRIRILIAIASIASISLAHAAEKIPNLDFKAYCSREAAAQPYTGYRALCAEVEEIHYRELVQIWGNLDDAGRKYCLDGVASYGELLSCAKIKSSQQ